jgi:ubiquinone/menaquinone biosynthesis C-methylase UbiE
VTGVDASTEMLHVAERRAGEAGVALTLVPGDAHALAFDDRAFDAAVCLRVLMHTPDWRRSLGELCRVSGRHLVFDYPARWSAAAAQALTRRVRHLADPTVEAYRVFSSREVARVLAGHGFRVAAAHRQFVLPIALHKRVGSERWTRQVEAAFDRVGLLRRFGSPVTLLAERCAS